ncbi:class I glutamine amidotransferase-like protein [Syncephalis fuscata]|nr:class I glutamine amidotransferase-like protein [Syncephalis fuscata]
MDVTVASVDTETVEVLSDTKIKMIADVPFSAVNQDEYDAIVVPGGISAHTLSQNEEVKRLLQRYHAQGKLLALICAAPTILAAAKVAPGIRITSYPLFEDHFEDYVYVKDPVVIEGNIITSRGPATTFDLPWPLLDICWAMKFSPRPRLKTYSINFCCTLLLNYYCLINK